MLENILPRKKLQLKIQSTLDIASLKGPAPPERYIERMQYRIPLKIGKILSRRLRLQPFLEIMNLRPVLICNFPQILTSRTQYRAFLGEIDAISSVTLPYFVAGQPNQKKADAVSSWTQYRGLHYRASTVVNCHNYRIFSFNPPWRIIFQPHARVADY